jgi:hypothetical protein
MRRRVLWGARGGAWLAVLLLGSSAFAAPPAKAAPVKAAKPAPRPAKPRAAAPKPAPKPAPAAVETPAPAPLPTETTTTAAPAPVVTTTATAYPPAAAPSEPPPAPLTMSAHDEAPPAKETGTRWYGWQVILANGASLTAAAIGWQQQNYALAGVGLGGQVLGGPIVHAVHGRWGATFLSLAINTIVPAGGLGVGAAVAATNVSQDVQVAASGDVTDPATYQRVATNVEQAAKTGPFIGYVVGVVLATGVDSLANGFEPAAKEPAKERSFAARLVPRIETGPSRAYVGVSGTF